LPPFLLVIELPGGLGFERLDAEARSHHEELRVLAECTDSAEVTSGYL